MKKTKYYITAIIILLISTAAFGAFANESVDSKAVGFLNSYGWETDGKCIEREVVIIPDPFDLVYENYNLLQQDAGLDLSAYMGMRGVRHTYLINNYPIDVGEDVRANVIIIDGKCVAGDICTVSLDGFIHSLKYSP